MLWQNRLHQHRLMHIRNRDTVNDNDYMKRIKNCDCVMFSGGNQMRLDSGFGGTGF